MKKTTLLAIAALSALTSSLSAATLIGTVTNPPGGNSAQNELAYLNTLLPANIADATFGTGNIDVNGEPTSITLNPSGYEYIKLSWGQTWTFYSVIGETANVTFQAPLSGPQGQPQGLSHYTWFNNTDFPMGPSPGPGVPGGNVPDGGSTVALLGAGLAVLGLLKKFRS
jgi:hypothetical protein